MTNKNKNKKQIASTLGGVFALVWLVVSFIPVFASEITPENIIKAVNQKRQENGVPPLVENSQLRTAARNKSIDMIVNNYFDHYALGKTPWMFIKSQNYDYQLAGENLAMGYTTSEGVVNAWMNSPSHRSNILNPEYQDIGVGVVKGVYTENGETKETTFTTEMLAQPKSKVSQLLDQVVATLTDIFK